MGRSGTSSGAKAAAAKGSPSKRTAASGKPKAVPSAAAAKQPAQPQKAGGEADGLQPNNMPALKDSTICFTGLLDAITREDAEDKVKAAGAKVMSSVSGNTTFLVLGSHLEDGRPVEATSKYKKFLEIQAKGKKCPVLLREADLLAILGTAVAQPQRLPVVSAADRQQALESMPVALRAPQVQWVDRHAPRTFEELVGNANAIKKLTSWLRDWDDVVLKGHKKPVPFKPGGGMPDNVNARAALVSGPPGIGKTTACRMVAKLHGGFDLLEYNASDARGQKIIQAMSEGIADNRTLSFGGSSSSTSSSKSSALGASALPMSTRRAVIIMDEVDGMGGGDRGGNAALIRMIKKTKNPIICVCNDHSNPRVRSLAFSCYDIRFSRPAKGTIAQRLGNIAAKEGLEVETNALECLAESCGNDLRQVLNHLQAISRVPLHLEQGLRYGDVKDHMHEMSKDEVTMLTPFDACKNLLSSSKAHSMPVSERLDQFFVDYSLVHLLVQENYLKSVASKPLDDQLLDSCAKSAALIATGDILSERLRRCGEWGLLPSMGLLSTVYPTYLTSGFVPFPEFPKFLGNYSRTSRAKRLAQEMHAHLRLSGSVSRRSLITSGYLDLLHSKALQPLQNEDIEGAVAVLDAYGLQREHLAEHLTELRQHLGEEDAFKLIDPKVKAAMTREFNNGVHAVKVVLPSGKKRKMAAPEADDLGEEGDADVSAVKEKAADGGEEAEEEGGGSNAKDDLSGGMVRRAKAKRGAAKAKGNTAKATGSSSLPTQEAELAATAASPSRRLVGKFTGKVVEPSPANPAVDTPARRTAGKPKATEAGPPPRTPVKASGKSQPKAKPKADAKPKAKAKAGSSELGSASTGRKRSTRG